MDIKDHLQILLSAGNTIDTLWNVFIIVHLSLISAIYFLNRPFAWVERVVIIIAYSVFAFLNYGALVDSYRLYYALIADIHALGPDAVSKFKATAEFITMHVFIVDRTQLVTGIHLAAWIAVLAFINWKDRVIKPNPARAREV